MLKMQNDELEQSALTFQPKLSTYAAENAKSKLQLNNDPSYFLDWFVTILLNFMSGSYSDGGCGSSRSSSVISSVVVVVQ